MLSSFFSSITKHSIILADLPSLDNGFRQWIEDQAGTLVILAVIVFSAVFLIKQSWGRLIGTIIIGGVVFFVIGQPQQTLDMIGNIVKQVTGG